MAILGIQLYSVREKLKEDYSAVISQLAAMGYQAVETAGYPGASASEAKSLFDSHGLQVLSQHGGLPIGDDMSRIIDEALMMGAKYLVTGGPHGGWDTFSSLDSLKASADAYLEAVENVAPHGIKIGYHNHDLEMNILEGKLAMEHFLELTGGKVIWEMDTYWVKVGGQDPVALLKTYGELIPLLHIKDGPGVKGEPMVAVGEGVMDFAAILSAASNVELYCVELDQCATDMMAAVERSIGYLKGLI